MFGSLCALAAAAFLGAAPPSDPAPRRHLRLVRAEPAAGAVVTAPPPAIRLWFSERPELAVTTLRLTGPDRRAVRLAALHQGAAADAPVVARIAGPLPAGRYTVAWRTMARDGHVMKGEYAFTLR